ncbi:DUF4412 domain-containing protein [Algoriphagus sp. CAU 1675]|uniref:DUF4412 domain-containing protein n=1 Tax=Algoriphagus sp. CAU 1675 TaxID=3032597 RepID=UPI0023DAE078|nr:DUF4412 domain-containing protein [Algoriphagus sp. CAU 1675]MDF2158069.1 DUF4412 domain-containing protein [Algoriphagus sp. CAU 1675]
MNTKTLILSLSISLSSITLQAQSLKGIKNAASRGINKALEKKAENEAEKSMTAWMEGLGNQAETLAEYNFSGFLTMEVTSKSKNGKSDDPVRFKNLISETGDYSGMEIIDPKNSDSKTTLILDPNNMATIILLTEGDQKSSLSYSTDSEQFPLDLNDSNSEDYKADNFHLEKTGNTKTILGYECEEYAFSNEEGEGTYWVTLEPIEGYNLFFPGSSNPMISNKSIDRYSGMFENIPSGSFMEMQFMEKNGNQTEMKVVEIELSHKTNFQMTDYPNAFSSRN